MLARSCARRDGWEENLLPSVAHRHRDLADNSWEDRLLPWMSATGSTRRRDIAEVDWEDRLLPGKARLGTGRRATLAEAAWEDRLLPETPYDFEAATAHKNLDAWERLLPGK